MAKLNKGSVGFDQTDATIALRPSLRERAELTLGRHCARRCPAPRQYLPDIDVPRYSLTNYRRCGRAKEATRLASPASNYLF